MLMGRAKQLCPDLVTIPYDFDGYNTVSRILYNTVARWVDTDTHTHIHTHTHAVWLVLSHETQRSHFL